MARRKRLTINQKEYGSIIKQAQERNIPTKGLEKFPKRITQKILQKLRNEIKEREKIFKHTFTDELISRLQALPATRLMYVNRQKYYVDLSEFYHECIRIINEKIDEFGAVQYEEYLLAHQEEIINALDTIIYDSDQYNVKNTMHRIMPILNNKDMTLSQASIVSDLSDSLDDWEENY